MILSLREIHFPSHDEPNKGKKWIQEYIKACWEDFGSIQTNSFYSGRYRYATIDSYMIGEQNMAKYFDLLDINSANEDKSWLKHTKEPIKIAPKFVRIAISNLLKNQFGIDISAVDATSAEEDMEYYARNKARIIWRREMAKMGGNPDELPEPDGNFQTEEDLDLYVEYTYKHRMAIEAEQILDLILQNSKFEHIREAQITQLFHLGGICYQDYFAENGEPRARGVELGDVIVSRFRNFDASDAFYLGEVKDYSVADIRLLDKEKEITKAQYDEIYASAKGIKTEILTNDSYDPKDYESQRVRVLDIEFKSVNTILVERGFNKDGNPTLTVRESNYKRNPKNQYEEVPVSVIYEGKWIVGTDIYFGCQLQTNIKRSKNNPSDVNFSRTLICPQIHNMETQSLGEAFIPHIDTIQISWMKYQDVIVRAKKSGYNIDISALENIPLGKGGKAFTPSEQIDFLMKTGNMITRSLLEDDNRMNSPVTPLPSLFGQDAASYWEAIQSNIMLLQQISGFNEITDGSSPDSRMLNGVAKLAAESTNNAIDILRRAEKLALQSLMYGLLIRVQDAAVNGDLDGFTNGLGKNSIEFFRTSPDISARELGLKIIDKPNELEKQDLRDAINLAIQQGQITIADKYFIMGIDNHKHAQAALQLRVKKYMESQQEINRQNIELNAKAQQESNAQAAQVKLQEIDAETQSKIAQEEARKNAELELLDRKYSYELQLKQMEVGGRIEQNRLQADAKTYSSDRQSKTQKEIKEMENETETEAAS